MVVHAQEATPEVRSLKYSVHQSERTRAYPGEIVALSCIILGERLGWDIKKSATDISTIHTFVGSDEQGKGFTGTDDGLRFSAVLDYFIRPDNSDLPICQSTMAVIPDGNNISNVTFDIICRAESPNITQSVKYEVSIEATACAGNDVKLKYYY